MYSQVIEKRAIDASVVDGDLRLTVDGKVVEVAAVWLRDACTDPASRDAVSGQRLFNIVDLPAELRVRDARIRGDRVEVEFAPDGHRSTFELDALIAADAPAPLADSRTEQGKRLWRTAAEASPLRSHDWAGYLAEPTPALREVVGCGFALLRGVPTEPGQVTKVAETFGFVRETNYGRLFDVRVEENAVNLAFTGLAISPHTDNPYRDPVPTLQLLHCLHNASVGGESGLVDGFAAAATLRERDPRAFEILTGTAVTYRFDSPDAHLSAVTPLISLDQSGRIREIRFNNRSMAVPRLRPDLAREFYRAYRAFAELLYAPEARLDFHLGAGDCLIFDNTRLLHARTAFAANGDRHLQGTYADLDGLLSTIETYREIR
ncbi:TauD/TfdA family dioxygenase [Rhodococcus sp. PvR099]|uniref:2-trimethylaminoethylphosphonate dioxygenase n=1 Tax=Rhodococcus sp. PvR099 TaxID=2806602 RepID=UPI001AE36FE1|nr:TauD/TfdA family dioxygenase [Rhodococcus sp. PvR099]MBP1162206.1 gamma-butyrobetaine dioxygenase [Rhodococcus sp. PvR099]